MLRRKLDYSFPNQRAEVYIADAGAWRPHWRAAGVWYTAGSNTTVFSHGSGRGELGPAEHVVERSNRRFRDDEFLLPRAATEGAGAIRVGTVHARHDSAVSGPAAAAARLERDAL